MLHITENFKLRDDEEKEVEYTQHVSKETGKTSHHFSYFACTCNETVKQYWKNKLQTYFSKHNPEEDADYVSQLIMEISHIYNGGVSISADMWFGITTTLWIGDDAEPITVYMQCDEVSIGLLAIVEILEKILPDE